MAFETDFAKEFENFRQKCLELEEKRKKDEMRFLMLETEIENLKKKNQELEGNIIVIQKVLDDQTTNGENESEALYDIMAENKVLEYEKQKAESEVCLLKAKVKELESNMNVKEDINMVSKGTKEVLHNQVRKQLSFEEVGFSNKKMAPPTPGVGQSSFPGVINISDEDMNYNDVPEVNTVSGSRKHNDLDKSHRSFEGIIEKTNLELIDEIHMNECESSRSAKRKRVAKIVTSDDEISYDDNAPISTLKKRHHSNVEITSDEEDEEVKEDESRRSLTRLRRLESKNKQDKRSIDLNKTFSSSEEDEEDNDVVDESESEGESLGGFIVDSSESVSKSDSESDDNSDESEDVLNAYKATLEKIGRKKVLNFKWDLEGDMLSDFGKDPELCMRAVCALYRQQTDDEKESKVTIYQNERGFSQPDANRASDIAEFLTDRVPDGDVIKTVEELKEYDSKGVELCMKLAAKYSKQLFKIYQNEEDPYFKPS